MKWINLHFHKLKDLKKCMKKVKLNKQETVKLFKKMVNNMLSFKIQFQVIQDLEEELWQTIFLGKHLPNVRNNPKTTLINCCMKKIETSLLNLIHNPLLNFDQFNISYHSKNFILIFFLFNMLQ